MKYLAIFGSIVAIVVGATVWLSAAPAVDNVAANPAYVVINTPTNVLFTAHIPDPSVISTGVNLLKVDSTGKALAVVGTMRDDGSSGDAVAGDRLFSFNTSLSRSTVGREYYRVSVAFKGTLQRMQSQVITLYFDPFRLPPDPGETGKQTLEGIDSDKDGARDDVQRFIAITYTSPPARAASTQFARAVQDTLMSTNEQRSIADARLSRFRAIDCLYYVDPAGA